MLLTVIEEIFRIKEENYEVIYYLREELQTIDSIWII